MGFFNFESARCSVLVQLWQAEAEGEGGMDFEADFVHSFGGNLGPVGMGARNGISEF